MLSAVFAAGFTVYFYVLQRYIIFAIFRVIECFERGTGKTLYNIHKYNTAHLTD